MPPESDGWLREYLETILNEVRNTRSHVEALDKRVTIVETERSQQSQSEERKGFSAPHWALVGITAASVLWSVFWTLLHP